MKSGYYHVLFKPNMSISFYLELVGMNGSDNIRKCLRKSEITKSEKKILKMKSVLSEVFTNPFSDKLQPDKLDNVASGCPTSNDVTECLISKTNW